MRQKKIIFAAVLVFLVGMALSIKLSADITPADNEKIISEGLNGKLLVRAKGKQKQENEPKREEGKKDKSKGEEDDGIYDRKVDKQHTPKEQGTQKGEQEESEYTRGEEPRFIDLPDGWDTCGTGCTRLSIRGGQIWCVSNNTCTNRPGNCDCHLLWRIKETGVKYDYLAGPREKAIHDSDYEYRCSCMHPETAAGEPQTIQIQDENEYSRKAGSYDKTTKKKAGYQNGDEKEYSRKSGKDIKTTTKKADYQNGDENEYSRKAGSYNETTKKKGDIERVDPGLYGKLTKYNYCGKGCGGKTNVIARANSTYYVKCPVTTKQCKANPGQPCFCAAYWSPKGSNARNFYSKGIKGGKVSIPAARSGDDWYSYCVK
jgi:hypothetical protein